tara:strand:- start:1704 stop:2426 length:723 start_codon:yes stop_codon:yes gene_type:complete
MALTTQAITQRGIAQQSGLDTLSSIINYTGEFINFGDAFDYGTTLNTDTDYASVSATPHIGALVNSPPTVVNQWYRYHTDAPIFTNPGSPTSGSGFFNIKSILTGGLPSYSGIYQKLSLTTGKEYKITIQTTSSAAIGDLYINTYTPSYSTYRVTSIKLKELPNASGDISMVESTFIAESKHDIILIYGTTLQTSNQTLVMSNISIQEKQEYLIPVYATDMFGNAHKVLRLPLDEKVSLE